MTDSAIRRFRQSKNLTQENLARRLDVTTGTIIRAERTGRVSIKIVESMVTAFPDDDILGLLFPRQEKRTTSIA